MRKSIIYIITILSIVTCPVSMAQDTTFYRVVTVEREYQPDIEQAHKIHVNPNIFQEKTEPYSAVYSDYSYPLSVGYNLRPLHAAKAEFRPLESTNGLLETAIGHRNSHLKFDYSLPTKHNSSLDIYTNHDAYWGGDTKCDLQAGLKFITQGKHISFWANIEGNMDYWRYSKILEDDIYGPINLESGNRIIWNAKANIGVSSKEKLPVRFKLQTGYKTLGLGKEVQHLIDTRFNLSWTNDTHTAGVEAKVKDMFYMPNTSNTADGSTLLGTRHAIRIEPYYAYKYKNFHLHAGVNIDLNIASNIGDETWLSQTSNLGFAPSANLKLKWHTQNNRFHLYTDITGLYGTSMTDDLYDYCPYIDEWSENIHKALYNPIGVTIGFKIRPINTLLIDLHASYAWRLQDYYIVATVNESLVEPSSILHTNTNNYISTRYSIEQQDYHKWGLGATIHYHYRDLLTIHAAGNYYFYLSTSQPMVYDQPKWDAKMRVDVHIDNKWSIYSDNYFAGKRVGCTSKGDVHLKPTIALNIGGQYSFNTWLKVYLQLNNYLNRKNDILYNFQEQGCHFLVGVKYTF